MQHLLPIYLLSTLLLMGYRCEGQNLSDTIYAVDKVQLYFGDDDATLDSMSGTHLDSLLLRIGDFDSTSIQIWGHTDDRGTQEYNLKLSAKRAQAVHEYIDTGYNIKEIEIYSVGEQRPDASNSHEAGRARNRRVTVILRSHVMMSQVHGQVAADSLGESTLVRLGTNIFADSTYTDSMGNWSLVAPIGRKALLTIERKGHLPILQEISISSKTSFKKLAHNMTSIAPGRDFKLASLHFHGNQSYPLPGSLKSVKTLGRFMKNNAGTCIEIQGHINVPNEPPILRIDPSFDLSIARAKVVYDYLVLFPKIDHARMYYRGYGNWRMLYPRAKSEKTQAQNRRVEILICPCEQARTEDNHKLRKMISFYELKGRSNLFR